MAIGKWLLLFLQAGNMVKKKNRNDWYKQDEWGTTKPPVEYKYILGNEGGFFDLSKLHSCF